MERFREIYRRAAKRKGGQAALEELLPKPKTAQQLARIGDNRYLSQMTRRIFQAGFVWRVVESKWADFERVFEHFDPQRWANESDEAMAGLMSEEGIIRNYDKILSVRDNARFILEVANDHGSFAKLVSRWPSEDIVGLWDVLKRHGRRLGGQSGAYFLRAMGKDTFILSGDVVAALVAQEVVARYPGSKRALRTVQEAFNTWREQSDRPLCEISRVLASSVD